MVQKPLRYPNSDCAEMAIRLHKFESTKVSGPGSSRRKITEILWTKEDAMDAMLVSDEEYLTFESLLKSLEEQNHLMRIPEWKDGKDGFVTRTAETLRIIGHTYEYWHRGRPGVDAIRWEIVPKFIPRRDISPSDFIERLTRDIGSKSGGDESETSLGNAISEVIGGIVTHFQEIEGIPNPKFSEFQYRATRDGLFDALGYGGRGTVLVAGVGSGKTLGFMLPPLILAKRDLIQGKRPYGAHLFLYPRKALAIDQFSKSLKPYAKAVGIPILQVHSEMSKHYKSLDTKSVYRGITRIHAGNNRPRLIVSSLETLKNRISHPTIVGGLFSRLETVTIDEVHLQSGVQGAQVAMLMRRIRQLSPNKTTWIGASATIAKPEDHLARLMGIDSASVKLIEPIPDEMQIDGVVHHSFMRPSGLISQAGVLTNATSLMVHHRRDDLSKRPGPKQSQSAPKVITFADNLELLGAWNDDFRENERTDVFDIGMGQTRWHPRSENMHDEEDWSSVIRELPYARRFQDTLERRIENHGGIIPQGHPDEGGQALAPVFQKWRGKNVCQRCKDGERFEIGHADLETMFELSKLVHRAPFKPTDPVLPFRIDNEIFMQEGIIGTMDLCPYLQSASCTSFSSHPVEKAKRIGDTSGRVRFDFASRATSRIQSSKSEDYSEEVEDLSLAVFRARNDLLHSVEGAKGEDFVDVVMASPSLEVGVDLPNLTESVMTRAVRNLASYRQKAGRVGRESMSEALNLTMATDSSNDLHYYRQPRKLIDRGRLEPVPLKEKNEAVARSTAYLSIWDILVKRGELPEALMEGTAKSVNRMINNSFEFINDPINRTGIHTHIKEVLDDERYPVGTDWFDAAIDQVRDELALLLKPLSGYRFDPPLPEPRTVIAGIKHHRGSGRSINAAVPIDDANELVEELQRSKEEADKRRRNLGFLRQDNPDLLDSITRVMELSSPNLDEIENLIDDIQQMERDSDNSDLRRKLRAFRRSFDDFFEATENLQKSNIDMLAFRAIEQYQNLTSPRNEDGWKSYYFSATLRTLKVFENIRKDPWFIAPDALYIHPHMKQVRLTDPDASDRPERLKHLNLREDQALIPLSEALHSFLPGMWTRRLPQTTFKVLARDTVATGGGFTLRATLNLMEEQGLKYEIIDKSLPAPPGLIGQIQVISPTEIPIRPLVNKRIINTSAIGPEVLDRDEGNPEGQDCNRSRIPKSFSQSWLHIKLEQGTSVNPYIDLSDDERLVLSNPVEESYEEIQSNSIIHPLAESAFSSVKWHDDTVVTEYVYGLMRTLRGGDYDGSEVFYANQLGAYTSFGQKINTEGIAFTLDSDSIGQIKQDAAAALVEGKPEWSPSMIRSFRAFLRGLAPRPLSNFVLDDIVGTLIAYWRSNGCPALSFEKIVELSRELTEDNDLLESLVINRVDARLRTPNDETQLTLEDVEVRQNRRDGMFDNVRTNLNRFLESQEDFVEHISLWLHRTILMSFGVSAVSATQRIAGGDSNEIGFGLTDDSWEGRATTVVIYDRAECGNGNVSVARTFMHIPNISRSAKGRRGGFLPSMDFLSSLEEVLLPCAQQHCDILGLEYQRTGGEESVLHRSMVDYTQFGKEIHHVGKEVWSALGINGPTDGWKLPLLHYIRRELAEEIEPEQDDVTRATRVCWNGCPECIERIDVVQGGFAGLDYLDKSVIDFWFRGLRDKSEDYIDIEPDSLIDGTSGLQLGDLHTIALEPEDRRRPRIRSLMLPWTIGVDLNRSNLEEGIRLIIRQSDLVGHRQSEPNEGVAMGMPSSAFKRLLWFDLLMTAYLDLRGAFSPEEKKIKLVYYDARDITFDDVGLAPQLLEALRAQAKIDQSGHLETFSDMLIWLARRGFNIQMCIDKRVRNRPDNAPVRNFVNRLRSPRAEGRIELFERDVGDDAELTASMHKKTMITPIFVLKGTANMTRSGAGRNEEDVDHVMFGSPQYESMKSSCVDTISRAIRLN